MGRVICLRGRPDEASVPIDGVAAAIPYGRGDFRFGHFRDAFLTTGELHFREKLNDRI
jgi:hypothetical protein